MRTSTRRPAASGTVVECCGGDANIWWMSKTSGSSVSSSTVVPSTVSTQRPSPVTPIRQSPSSSGTKPVCDLELRGTVGDGVEQPDDRGGAGGLLGDRRSGPVEPAEHDRRALPGSGQLVGAGAAQRVRERGAHGGDDVGPAVQGLAESGERGDHVRQRHAGRPAAQRTGVLGAGPDHGDPAQGRRPAAAGSRRCGAGPRPRRRPLGPAVRRPRCGPPPASRRRRDAVQGAGAGGQPQDPADLLVDRGLADAALAHGLDQRLAPLLLRAGHGQVEGGAGGGLAVVGGAPVGDDHAVEAPLALQRLGQQVVLGHGSAVDRVVGGHDHPRVGVGDHGLEGGQVELAQRPLVDPVVDGEPVGLRVVGDVVLGARPDALRLHAADVGGGQPAREQRVLGEALEVPAAQRRPVQVDRRAEDDVDALAHGLAGEQPADAPQQLLVPRRRHARARRQGRGGLELGVGAAADADRAVGHGQRAQPDLRRVFERPGARAGEQPHLRLQVQLPDEGVEVGIGQDMGRGHGSPVSKDLVPPPLARSRRGPAPGPGIRGRERAPRGGRR